MLDNQLLCRKQPYCGSLTNYQGIDSLTMVFFKLNMLVLWSSIE